MVEKKVQYLLLKCSGAEINKVVQNANTQVKYKYIEFVLKYVVE